MTGNIARDDADGFIAKWQGVTASELSTSQSFLIDLCCLLGVDAPHATPEQDYMFERPITFAHGDGSTSSGRIDLYRRGAFVLESKKLKQGAHTKGFDDALLRARSQAENYARALPADEGRPPLLLVVDVGNRIELYADFTRSGATYTPYPDPRSHRIALDDLRDAAIRDRLRRAWQDPMSLDPSREYARVTREIAGKLADLARSLERDQHAPEAVAQFLMRCLFTMFAEDVRLLPETAFRDLLHKHRAQPDVAMRMLAQLWRDMDSGGFSAAIACDVLRFNGKLFKQPDTLPLDGDQIGLLIEAANTDWKHVEPAIFGTLLERALVPSERHKLGAHYTPRAYVERLVLPTVIEPLRAEWADAKAAALVQIAEAEEARGRGMANTGKKSQPERLKQYNIELRKARDIILAFHRRLCAVRVLDPACGSGNFLYVTLEHLKRLEGEILNALEEFGLSALGVSEQTGIDVDASRVVSIEAETVDPHNLLGIELNPRAAAIAEVVLWIGYLQWHFRTRGDVKPPQPVVRDFANIENRDAVLAYDGMEYVTDETGKAVTRWDGETMKLSPVTGEQIPDETARKPVERYLNPRKAAWPKADFVVGNPPFIGTKRMKAALGEGYVSALRSAWPEVPESSDFVMYWWHHAAALTQRGAVERFGFITTNSIRQAFNRRVIEAALANKKHPLMLAFAVPDHPWVDSADGAAVRIAMTVGTASQGAGRFASVIEEIDADNGETRVMLDERSGVIHADLRVGADIGSAHALRANDSIAGMGVALHGSGFILQPDVAKRLRADGPAVIKPYLGGRDLLQERRERYLIDFFGMTEAQARAANPAAFQHVIDYVKPERDHNNRKALKELWWRFGWERPQLRAALAGLPRYIGTTETSKHRPFQFIDSAILADHSIVCIALSDEWQLGVLSATVHVVWALGAGGRLGVGNDPRYNKTRCFDPFPFPDASDAQQARIRDLAEQLDAHRKRQQAAYPDLTLTGLYNVLEQLRSGETLTAKARTIHAHGLVSVLRQLHDDLDAAVLDAYGWSDLLPLLRVAHGLDAVAVLPPPGEGARRADEGMALTGRRTVVASAGSVPASDAARHRAPRPAPRDDAKAFADAQADGLQTHPLPPDGEGKADAKRAFDDAILERLVALNAQRAAEEARGQVRWLRPAFQHPEGRAAPEQTQIDAQTGTAAEAAPATAKKQPWPKDAVQQVRVVADALAASPIPLTAEQLAAGFTARGPWKKRVPQLLDMLVALGRATPLDGGRYRGNT